MTNATQDEVEQAIKQAEDDYERHNKQRKEMGLSWSEYIDGQSPALEETMRRVIREELGRETDDETETISE